LRISTSSFATRLSAQPHQLLALSGAQAVVAAAFIAVGLGDPAAQARLGDPQIGGEHRYGFSRIRASSTAR